MKLSVRIAELLVAYANAVGESPDEGDSIAVVLHKTREILKLRKFEPDNILVEFVQEILSVFLLLEAPCTSLPFKIGEPSDLRGEYFYEQEETLRTCEHAGLTERQTISVLASQLKQLRGIMLEMAAAKATGTF